ncbi:unnamed protein product [Caenorhabditis auriculariae]|uniref:Uncharacterized protein n=1 Tax=Caenorhabditis auriculariae TaxID=2777116 RepID=A0A8S1H6T5_9PELO|nr:unnamed protein product [Caenorhabditis auriculariae]
MPEETKAYYEGRLQSLDEELNGVFMELEQLTEDLDSVRRRIDDEPTPALELEKQRLEDEIETFDSKLDEVYDKIADVRKQFNDFLMGPDDEETTDEESDDGTESSSASEASSSSDSYSDTDNEGF